MIYQEKILDPQMFHQR